MNSPCLSSASSRSVQTSSTTEGQLCERNDTGEEGRKKEGGRVGGMRKRKEKLSLIQKKFLRGGGGGEQIKDFPGFWREGVSITHTSLLQVYLEGSV